MSKLAKFIEQGIIYTLIFMMAGVIILATIELGYILIKSILQSNNLLIDLDNLLDIFGVFLLVLIGIELLHTIKVYLKRNVVHVEVVILVAIIATARQFVVLKIEDLPGGVILALAGLILALSISYYLIRKAGLLICDFNDPPVKEEVDIENHEDKIIAPDESSSKKKSKPCN